MGSVGMLDSAEKLFALSLRDAWLKVVTCDHSREFWPKAPECTLLCRIPRALADISFDPQNYLRWFCRERN